MRRKRLSILAAAGLIPLAGVIADIGSAGATTPPVSSPNLITQQAIPATAPAVAPAPAPALPTQPAATPAVAPAANALAPVTQLPTPRSIPTTASGNEIGGNLLPGQDSTTGSSTTAQSSPLAHVDAAIKVPISVEGNAIGRLGQAASALGLTTGQPSAQTTQNGAVSLWAPVSICSINVGLTGNTGSDCHPAGATTQSGMPIPGFPLVKDLPTNAITPSAQIDGVLPVNACSIVVAVDASAGSRCEPTHGAPTQTGSVPVDAPVTLCSVEGVPSSFCTGEGDTALPNGIPALLLWALAATGAPLLLELLIGAMALLTGLVIDKLSQRGGRGAPRATSPAG